MKLRQFFHIIFHAFIRLENCDESLHVRIEYEITER